MEERPFVIAEGPVGTWIRRAGLWLLLLASFLPYHGCRAHPEEFHTLVPEAGTDPSTLSASGKEYWDRSNPGVSGVSAAEGFLRTRAGGGWDESGEELLFATSGRTYAPYGIWIFLVLPIWALALAVAGGRSLRARRVTAVLLWAGLGALFPWVLFRWVPNPDPSAPPGFGIPPEILAFFGLVGFTLLARPAARRALPDVEALVSVQALVGIHFSLFVPAREFWLWCVDEGYPLSAVLRAQWENYRAGFWLSLPALAGVAAPLYFSEASLRRLYDRLSPWPSNSSTPTPTSTSTGSTPTGRTSSDAPAPPGSSPS